MNRRAFWTCLTVLNLLALAANSFGTHWAGTDVGIVGGSVSLTGCLWRLTHSLGTGENNQQKGSSE
jgi:hypothetical protein